MSSKAVDSPMLWRALATTAFLLAAAAPPIALAEVTSPVLLINDDAATAKVTVQRLRGNVSVLMGSGGNITVYTGPTGKLMVDGGIAVSRPRLEPALDSTGSVPLKYLINTHYHWDHTDGNVWLHEKGAIIIAQQNTLKRLSTGTRVIEWGFTFPPTPPAGLPSVVVEKEKTMDFDGETVVMRNYGYGHTDTDLSVYLKKADVLAVGDIWWNGHYPFIDSGGGGGIDGVIAWVNALLKVATDKTIIVPGHGDVSDRAHLVGFRDMLVAIRGNVAALKKQGKTLAETISAKPTAAFDAEYGTFLISPAFFVQLVYLDV